MVLQRDVDLPIWGQATPGDLIKVEFSDQRQSTTSDAEGNWKLFLNPLKTNFRGSDLMIRSSNENREIKYQDVLVGEVWLCSGQSNMGWTVNDSKDADIELLTGNYEHIRLHDVGHATARSPQYNSYGTWLKCNTENLKDFSAVAYFFGRDLHQALKAPVGLINSSWGGTPAIAWTRANVIENNPLFASKVVEWEEKLQDFPAAHKDWLEKVEQIESTREIKIIHQDKGIAPNCSQFHETDYNDSNWPSISLPATWAEELGDFGGAVWYRKVVDTSELKNRHWISFHSPPIIDYDTVWINGIEIGSIAEAGQNSADTPRVYQIPAKALQSDQIIIAIRAFSRVGSGGMNGRPFELYILDTNGEKWPLAGEWKCHVETKLPTAHDIWGLEPYGLSTEPPAEMNPNRPSALANAMIAPIVPYAMAGAIWYQGESDTEWAPNEYAERLRQMIEDWRQWWGQKKFPFGIVQIANYIPDPREIELENWPRLRESQRQVANKLNDCGLAVTIDIGEANDVHPLNKQEVGRRLSRWALCDIYRKVSLRGGPELIDAQSDGNTARLTFSQIGKGLIAYKQNPLQGFSYSADGKNFHPASARIDSSNTVIIEAPETIQIKQVRYAWADAPDQANLYNSLRIPATPFSTDPL